MPIVGRRRQLQDRIADLEKQLGVKPSEAPKSRVRRVFVRREPAPAQPTLSGERLARKAVSAALRPDELAGLAPAERALVEPVVKAVQWATDWTKRAAMPLGARDMRPVSAAVVARRAAEQLAPSSSITPIDIALAMEAQGISSVLPFGPGQPLLPFFGYGRQPRQYDYKTSRNTTTTTRPDRMPYRTLLQLWKSYDVPQICVAPETLVVAKRGVVPVAEIETGDEVLTHRGRWRRVTATMVNPVGDRKVFRVSSGGLDALVATGEHPMLVARYTHDQHRQRVMRALDFVGVADLEPHGEAKAARWHYDAAVLPALSSDGEAESFDVLPWLGEGFASVDGVVRRVPRARLTPVPSRIPYSQELGRLLGWYLAEGSQSHGTSLSFSLGPEEARYAEQILADASAVFGVTGRYSCSSPGRGRGIVVSINSSVVARLFRCGTARSKTVPAWAWAGGPRFLRAVLDAWALGDGCTVDRKGWAQRTLVVTASLSLAWQMRLIGIAAGLKPSVKRKPGGKTAEIRGGLVRSGPSYHVEWAEKLQRAGRWSFECDGRYLATAIRSVEEVPYAGLVYNLAVEEDESYVTTAGTVHNCTRYSTNSLRSMRVRFQAMEGYDKNPVAQIKEAKKRLRRPDGKRLFRSWLAMNQRNLWIFDSAPIFRQRDRAGRVKRLINFSAMTLAPMLDYFGEFPDAPAPAFQQFITGVPWDWLTWDDVIYEPFWPETDSPYGTPPLETVLINANCFSADTEVLTRRGWKKFSDVDMRVDEIATRNPKTKAFEWQAPTKYYKAEVDEDLYHFTGAVDMLVTAGHRMLVDRRPKHCPSAEEWGDGEWRIQAEDLANVPFSTGVRIPITSEWEAPDLQMFHLEAPRPDRPNKKGFTSMSGDDFAAFMGMWLAEGSCAYEPGRRNDIWISQQRDSKGFEAYKALLDRLVGGECHYNGKVFRFHNSALAAYLKQFGHATEKRIPAEILEMSRRQLEIFWHYYYLGDGASGRVQQITTSSKRMADGLQEVAQKVGFSASVRPIKPQADRMYHDKLIRSNATRWAVTLSRVTKRSFRVHREHYAGKVYCVSVPNRVIYVRRNGQPTWCGQTDVRLQLYFLDFFTKGTVPEAVAIAPEEMTSADDLADFQEQWEGEQYGTQAKRWGLNWLPHGTELQFYKPMVFDPELAEYVMRRTVAAHLLTPQNLGILDDVNRATSDTQVDQEFRVSTLPTVGYYEDILDSVLQETWTLPVQIRFDTGREKEDRLTDVKAWCMGIEFGMVGPTEGRDKLFGLPTNPEERVGRFIFDQRIGPVPLAHMMAVGGEIDVLTGAPLVGSVKPIPYELPGGGTPVPAEGPQARTDGEADGGGARPKGTPPKSYPRPLLERSSAERSAAKSDATGAATPPVAEGYARSNQWGGSTAQGTAAVGPPELLDEADDLRKWHRQSRRRIDDGKPPRLFVSDAIRPAVSDRVWKALEGACSREAVSAAFKQAGPFAGGIVLQAEDTGRVLLVQRTPDHHDPDEAFARWEFPGGKLTGDDPWSGARREWEEETGADLPLTARHVGNWSSPDGVYVGYVLVIPRESDVRLAPQPEEVSAARWWAKDDLDDPAVRDKVTETLTRVLPLLKGWTA